MSQVREAISKPPLRPNLPTSLRLRRDKLRWIEGANPRNWGPALKEWGLSLTKKSRRGGITVVVSLYPP